MAQEQAVVVRSLEATAHWTAAVRAAETARPDGLFHDPWADLLSGPEGRAWIEQRSPESVLPIILRTRYFDEWLERVTGRDAIRQVVLMAAGLDTRAYRLAFPGDTRLFELDRSAVLEHKAAILRAADALPRCDRRVVEADLTEPWADALIAAGFRQGQPTAWLLEGFLFYLPGEALVRVLDGVTALAGPGSCMGFDMINEAMLTSPWTRTWVEMQAKAGAPWIGALDDPVGFLAARGWRAVLTQAGQPDANHGRWTLPVLPTTAPEMPHDWFVTAVREG